MKRDHGKVVKEKPVVIVRKKAEAKSAPTGPTSQTISRAASPAMQATKPASPPQPPQQVQQPVAPQASIPPAVAKPGARTKEQKRQAQRELLEVLRQQWPQAFP